MWRQVRKAYSYELNQRLGLGKGEPPPSHPVPEFESAGRMTYVEEAEEWPALVSGLIGVNIEELENEYGCLYLQKYVYPGTVITGDVRLSDVTTEELRVIQVEAEEEHDEEELGTGYVVILGDLHIDGTLELVGEYDLFVSGELHAENVIGNSGNAIIAGGVHVENLVWIETSKEGGWFWAPTIEVPRMVLCVDGEGPDYRPQVSGRFIEEYTGEEGMESLVKAVSRAEAKARLFQRVSALVQNGRASELGQALDED